jgi:septal ring factor EnvC (AmiA/AmiB activator)
MSLLKSSFCLLLILGFFPLMGQDKSELQKERDAISEKIKLTNTLIKEAELQQKTSSQKLALLQQQTAYRNRLIDSYAVEVRELERKIKENQEQIDLLQKELDDLKQEYAHLIQQAYRNRDDAQTLMYIFSAQSFNQAYKRMKFIRQYTEYREMQAEVIKRNAKELEKKNINLQQLVAEKKKLIQIKDQERQKLQADIKTSEELLTSLQQNEKQLRKQLRDQEKQRKELNKAIDRIIAEEIRKSKKNNQGTFTLTPEAKELSQKFSKNKGKLPWPTEKGIITGTFGLNNHPVIPGIKIENNGIDITTEHGSDVRAVFEGTVTAVLDFQHVGYAVIINHGSYRTVYSNLKEVLVVQGQKVTTKQTLGSVMTQSSSGKTVAHFEILYINSQGEFVKQNPAHWIAR